MSTSLYRIFDYLRDQHIVRVIRPTKRTVVPSKSHSRVRSLKLPHDHHIRGFNPLIGGRCNFEIGVTLAYSFV